MIVVSDFSVMYYRMLFGSKTAVIENTDYFSHLLMTALLQNVRQFELDKENRLILAVDCRKKNNWRTEYYEKNSKGFEEYKKPIRQTYKGNRVKDNTIPWDKIFEILEDFLETIKNYSDIQVIQHKRAEADDVIATVVRLYEMNKEICIVSNDKDFHQLITPNVRVYDPLKKKEIKIEKSRTLLLEHILTGQKRKDNIFPVRSKTGPAKAQKMMKELKGLLKIDKDLAERFEFNKKLIDLDCCPNDIKREIEEMLEERQFNFNHSGLISFCQRYGLRQHMDNMFKLRLSDSNKSSLW